MTSAARARTRPPAKRAAPRFCVCLSNDGHPAWLEVRKVYRRLPDVDAETERRAGTIDESDAKAAGLGGWRWPWS